jgi:hypothetical protein
MGDKDIFYINKNVPEAIRGYRSLKLTFIDEKLAIKGFQNTSPTIRLLSNSKMYKS